MEDAKKPYRKALRGLHSKSYHPIWEPGTVQFINGKPHSRLGDYGVTKDGVFSRIKNISDLGLSSWQRSTAVLAGSPVYSTGGARITRIEGKAAVTTFSNPNASAEIEVQFDKKYSVWIARLGVKTESLDALDNLAKRLVYHKKWSSNYVVITSVCSAEHIQVFVTTRNKTSCKLSGKAGELDGLVFGQGTLSGGVAISSAHLSMYSNGLASGPYACRMHYMKKGLIFQKTGYSSVKTWPVSSRMEVPDQTSKIEEFDLFQKGTRAEEVLNEPLADEQDIPE